MENKTFERVVGTLVERHKQFFPNATVGTQIAKLSEELEEYTKAYTLIDRDGERGDILYVLVSLLRFPEIQYVANYLLQKFHYEQPESIREHNLMLLLDTAKKVEDRYNNGVYYWTGTHYERDKSK